MSEVRNIRYTDDTLITDARITELPRWGQTATGYGRQIPTRFQIKYSNCWHRVYMMQYGNSGTPYIRRRGEDLVLSLHAEHLVDDLIKGVGTPTPHHN